MYNELRYQTKIHIISEKQLKKIKILHLLPLLNKSGKTTKTTKTCLHREEDSLVQACKIRANLTSRREV